MKTVTREEFFKVIGLLNVELNTTSKDKIYTTTFTLKSNRKLIGKTTTDYNKNGLLEYYLAE